MARAAAAALLLGSIAAAQNTSCVSSNSLYSGSYSNTLLNGTKFEWSAQNGQVTLLTLPHYTSLQALQASYGSKGLLIVGFPCNQFGGQEPGANDEILLGLKYVRPGNGFVPAFPLTTRIEANGLTADPVWSLVRTSCPSPVSAFDWGQPVWAPVTPSDFSWNFEQALVDKNGMLYRRYASAVDPSALAGDIEFLLAKQ